jgi:hypothetical protein
VIFHDAQDVLLAIQMTVQRDLHCPDAGRQLTIRDGHRAIFGAGVTAYIGKVA